MNGGLLNLVRGDAIWFASQIHASTRTLGEIGKYWVSPEAMSLDELNFNSSKFVLRKVKQSACELSEYRQRNVFPLRGLVLRACGGVLSMLLTGLVSSLLVLDR